MVADIKIKRILLLIIIVLLAACKKDISIDYKYVYTYASFENNKFMNHIVFYNRNEEIENEFKIETMGDLSYINYDYDNKVIFQYGPGGLLQIDIKKKTVKLISDSNICDAFMYNDEFIYVKNKGFNNDMSSYECDIYVNGKFNFSIDYMVNSILVNDGKYYISNLPSAGESIFLKTYDKNGILLGTVPYSELGTVRKVNGRIVWNTIESLLDIKTNKKITFVDKIYSIYDYVGDAATLSYNPENETCYYSNQKGNKNEIFENCKGYLQSEKFQFIIKQNQGFYIYNSRNSDKEIIKEFNKDNSRFFEEVYIYK